MSLPIDGTLDLQSVNKIINSPTPTSSGDVVNKAYVDAMAQGVIYKQAVQAASVGANVTVTAPGAALDGFALSAGNRVLLKDQTTPSQNGLWVWNGAAVAMTRPADFLTGAVAEPGTAVLVENGTINIDTLYGLIASANVTVDTTAETWTKVAGTNAVTVSAPLTLTGNNIALTTPLAIAYGGTGSATAGGGRAALSATGKYSTTIGDGATTTFTVTHNLGTEAVVVQVFDMATGNMELVEATVETNNTVQVGPFGNAPATVTGTIGSGTGKQVVVVG